MNITITLSDLLMTATGHRESLQVRGDTPLECLGELSTLFPVLNKWLYDEPEKLKPLIWLMVNDERIYADELTKSLNDGDRLFIMVAVLGG